MKVVRVGGAYWQHMLPLCLCAAHYSCLLFSSEYNMARLDDNYKGLLSTKKVRVIGSGFVPTKLGRGKKISKCKLLTAAGDFNSATCYELPSTDSLHPDTCPFSPAPMVLSFAAHYSHQRDSFFIMIPDIREAVK